MMKDYLISFTTACSFLSIIPVPSKWVLEGEKFFDSKKSFPIVGLFFGLVFLLLTHLLHFFLPLSTIPLLIVISLALISGAFHIDGLADTADGFLSSRPKDKILEIMKDSRVGVMGVVILIFYFLLKLKFLELIITKDYQFFLITVFLMPFLGRCSLVLGTQNIDYARSDGLGKLFWNSKGSTLSLCKLSLLVISGLLLFLKAIPFLLVYFILLAGWRSLCIHKIGGGTGDTLGALCELTELYVVVSLCVLL